MLPDLLTRRTINLCNFLGNDVDSVRKQGAEETIRTEEKGNNRRLGEIIIKSFPISAFHKYYCGIK
jgi:hypothetical protein